MMASLYPAPLAVDEVLELTGIGEIADRRTQKLSGGQTQRVRFAVALVSNPDLLVLDEPTVAMDVEGRHAFWSTMRAFAAGGKTILFATHYLEEADAYADRVVLMAHGPIVADGPPTEIKAMVGTRTIRATLPDATLEELERAARASRTPSAAARRSCSRCTDSDAGDPRAARRLPGRPRHRDQRRRARGGVPRSSPGGEDGSADEPRLPPLRAAAHVPEPAVLLLLARLPARPLLPDRGPEPGQRDLSGTGLSAPLYFMVGLAAFGDDERDALLRRAHRRRAGGRLEPAAAHHAALDARATSAPRSLTALPDGRDRPSSPSTPPGSRSGCSLSAHEWARMTGLILVGLLPFAALGIVFGHLLTPGLDRPGDGRRDGAVRAPRRRPGSRSRAARCTKIGEALPSYWLVQASHVALGGQGWTARRAGSSSPPGQRCSARSRSARISATPGVCSG